MAQRDTKFAPVSEKENWISKQVLNIAFSIHKQLGPGLLESIYEKCFCSELESRKIPFQRQKKSNWFITEF
jgi:GxxExxY protein